jgi:hyperosmotically inducible periplasmic protein
MKAARIAVPCSVVVGVLILSPANTAGAQMAADNTKVNQRDRQPSQPTADQQLNNRSDMEITRQLRKAIVSDKSLSTYAHNIKIITKGSKVTLKGPVRSADEQKSIEAKATEIAGAGNVTSDISITNPSTPAARRTSKMTKKAGT